LQYGQTDDTICITELPRPANNPPEARKKRRKNPAHRTVTRAFSFPIAVSRKQADILNDHISACWRLRNYLVGDRSANRTESRLLRQLGKETNYLTRAGQYASIKEYRKRNMGLSKVHSQVLQNVAVRVDEGHKRFFEALKAVSARLHRAEEVQEPDVSAVRYIGKGKERRPFALQAR
jgi:hypothetical protein